MASTVTIDAQPDGRHDGIGGLRGRFGKLNVGVYATGGVAVTASQFEFSASILHLDVGSSAGYVFEFDKTNLKILVYRQKDPAAAGGADIPLPEVANAVDLTAITPRFFALGK